MDPVQLDGNDVKGRDLKKPYGSITYDHETGRILIRVDDEVREDFWLEITVRPEVVDRVVAGRPVNQNRTDNQNEDTP